jgi:hypothetical protein
LKNISHDFREEKTEEEQKEETKTFWLNKLNGEITWENPILTMWEEELDEDTKKRQWTHRVTGSDGVF